MPPGFKRLTPWAPEISRSIFRQQNEAFTSFLGFKVKGVSFHNDSTGESRQELLHRMLRKERPSCVICLDSLKGRVFSDFDGSFYTQKWPVLLLKEPDNPVSPNAVMVISSKGHIGYVPESLTHHFEHDCTSGFVEWVSGNQQVEDSLLGAFVNCMPAVRVAHMQVLPEELVAAGDLSASLPPAIWAAVERLHRERHFGRCQLTGLSSVLLNPEEVGSPRVAPVVQPIWRVQQRRKVVRLAGFTSLCMPALFAHNYLDLEALYKAPTGSHCSGAGRHEGEGQSVDRTVAKLDAMSLSAGGANDSAAAGNIKQAAHGEQHSKRDFRDAVDASRLPGRDETACAAGKGGVCRQLLLQLKGRFGRRKALLVAKAMALDALRFSTALYDRDSDSPLITSAWHNDDVEEFIQLSWDAKQRISGQGFQLDVSLLFDLDLPSSLQPSDLPPSLRAVCVDM